MRQFTTTTCTIYFLAGCQLLLLARKSVLVSAQQQQSWNGCLCPEGNCKAVAIGEPTGVCFQIANGVAWNEGVKYIRPSFEPNADQYSRLRIPNCTFVAVFSSFSLTLTNDEYIL